ncbi:MAG: hypothetical protein IKE22_14265 [Atopobiaceae bacterium]|nr:hypothetical protein [Atopobiaceae bacterium]
MTCIGGLLDTVTGSVILTAGEVKEVEGHIDQLKSENAKLREWCSDFWKWADPPFALRSGTFDEYMTLVERAMKLGIEADR